MTRGRLLFHDFAPADKTEFLNLKRKYESFDDLLKRVDEWLATTGVEVVNFETVVLPGSPKSGKAVSREVEFQIASFGLSSWYQLIRVWYREAPQSEKASNA